jgi:hypothetical protein
MSQFPLLAHWLNGQREPFHLDDVSLKDIQAFLAWGGQQGWRGSHAAEPELS